MDEAMGSSGAGKHLEMLSYVGKEGKREGHLGQEKYKNNKKREFEKGIS